MPISARAVHFAWRRAVNLEGATSARTGALTWALSVVLLSACGSNSSVDESDQGVLDAGVDQGVGAANVRLRFNPGTDGRLAFGDVPFPSDLYRDADGRIAVGALPNAQSLLIAQLAEAMAELDGFGAVGPVYFYFDGAIDADSLPRNADASLQKAASVFVIDVDTNSPQAFERVPVVAQFDAEARQLAVAPARGRSFAPGRRYAAVVTSALLDDDGRPVGPSEAFVDARGEVAPEAPARLARAHASFSPVLAQLEQQGIARTDVVGMAVFRVQNVTGVLEDARALVRGDPPAFAIVDIEQDLDPLLGVPEMDAAGLELPGGVLHTGIGGVVTGQLSSRNFLVGEDGQRRGFEKDDVGKLIVRRIDQVPFTIWMPPAAVQLGSVPVILYVHDLHGDRSDSVVPANGLAAAGYAVVAIDLPFHGSRIAGGDEFNRFTGVAMPDGFGDGRGEFSGRFVEGAQLLPLHPAYYRGAMRQAIVDVMQVVHMIESGDFAPALEGTPYAGVAFDRERIGVLGVGVGGELGLVAATLEESIGAVDAVFPGGHITDGWGNSPARQSVFEELRTALAIPDTADPAGAPSPAMAVYQALLDAGDPFVLARALRRKPVNALLVMAKDDEVVPNQSTEALAYAIGSEFANVRAAHVSGLETLQSDGAVSGNFLVGDDAVTRILVRADPATHDALVHRVGARAYEPSVGPPFVELGEPEVVANPLDALVDQAVAFFDTWRICAAGNAAASCPASVMPLP